MDTTISRLEISLTLWAFITLIICGLIAWLNPVNHFILSTIFNADGDLYNNTLLVLGFYFSYLLFWLWNNYTLGL